MGWNRFLVSARHFALLSSLVPGVILSLVVFATRACAQTAPGGSTAEVAGAMTTKTARTPYGLELTLFTDTLSDGMFVRDQYELIDEGFELDKKIGTRFSVVGRVWGNHLLLHHPEAANNTNDPFEPPSPGQSYFQYALLQGGFGVDLGEQTTVTVLGGGYLGDVDGASAELDLSSTIVASKAHPLNLLYTIEFNSATSVSSGTLEFRRVLTTLHELKVYAGSGGFAYGGGDVGAPDGGAGLIFGCSSNRLRGGAELQGGYGTIGAYAMLLLWQSFSM
jgi:hypothetical protein